MRTLTICQKAAPQDSRYLKCLGQRWLRDTGMFDIQLALPQMPSAGQVNWLNFNSTLAIINVFQYCTVLYFRLATVFK